MLHKLLDQKRSLFNARLQPDLAPEGLREAAHCSKRIGQNQQIAVMSHVSRVRKWYVLAHLAVISLSFPSYIPEGARLSSSDLDVSIMRRPLRCTTRRQASTLQRRIVVDLVRQCTLWFSCRFVAQRHPGSSKRLSQIPTNQNSRRGDKDYGWKSRG